MMSTGVGRGPMAAITELHRKETREMEENRVKVASGSKQFKEMYRNYATMGRPAGYYRLLERNDLPLDEADEAYYDVS